MPRRLDILWPSAATDTDEPAYLLGWHLQSNLVCVAAIVPKTRFQLGVLQSEIDKWTAEIARRIKSEALHGVTRPMIKPMLIILGETRPVDLARQQVDAVAGSLRQRSKSSATKSAIKPMWLEVGWDSARQPVLEAVLELGQPVACDLCHVILYDAAFPSRFRHFAIKKRQGSTPDDEASETPFQHAIAQLNDARKVQERFLGLPPRTSYSGRAKAILLWPFLLLFVACRPFFNAIAWVLNTPVPASVPVVKGRSIKSFSLFFRLLNRRVVLLANLTEQYIKFNLMDHSLQPFHPLETRYAEFMSDLLLLVLDVIAGFYLGHLVPTGIAYFQASCSSHFNVLKSQVTWLIDSPAGFKINLALASILGKGVHLMVDVAQYAIESVTPFMATLLRVAALASLFGLTVQLGLLYDAIEYLTLQTYYLYLYFSKLHRVQFDLLSSLWKLFLGKKKNVLRNRVDSCEYDVNQLLIGTLLFTILFFVVATNSVFYLYFCLARFVVLCLQTCVWCPIVLCHVIPLYSISLWLEDAHHYPMDVYLQPLQRAHVSISFPNVHQKDCFLGDDLATDATRPTVEAKGIATALFTLHPLAFSFGALFTRFGAYLGALGSHYTVGKFLRCFFLGEYIPALPFAKTPMCHLPFPPSSAYMSTKELWNGLQACRW
ncbi:Nacetylglucosaminyl transferase component Gpi1 [Achlya hypogyna]|uniref:Nacetylglucosaminyl transferase component Gpi1 n=1 Tax=Achlya hypogyna TaxID=1202772 RepID=A0A1V9ZK16_ACHHY|nr:Nacetylglucosaminyl transferase component Gpi1 [Achlya hypogyna]